MNWRKGLFRLWLVGASLFIIGIAFISYSEIKSQFETKVLVWKDQDNSVMLPAPCDKARGAAGKDYTTKQGQRPGPWDKYAKPNSFDTCWYSISSFRTLYPEYNDLTDKEVSSKLYALRDRQLDERPSRWTVLAFLDQHSIRYSTCSSLSRIDFRLGVRRVFFSSVDVAV